jgi:hypothetical protein
MSEQQERRGVVFWILVFVGTAIALFVGSAMVAGVVESNEHEGVRKKAVSLSPINTLQDMILSGIKKNNRPALPCWYIGAIGFRLAEARDLKIPKPYAIDLANDPHLVEELAKSGFNAKLVISGIASQVYDSPLSPATTFDAQIEACAMGRP